MKSLFAALFLVASLAEQKTPSATEAWIKAPSAGETTAIAFVVVNNPTMYDFYLTSATSDAAGKVQFQKVVNAKTETAEFFTVAAYAAVELKPGGNHLLLSDLKRPLNPGDKVKITLTTDGGLEIEVEAEVRKN